MESIKKNLFSSNTCHKIIPGSIPAETKDQSLQSRITHLKDIEGKSQSRFDEAFIIEVPCLEEAQKIATFWQHQTHIANIVTSALFGSCMTGILLVTKSLLMPYSLISTISLIAGFILARNQRQLIKEQVQLYSDPTLSYAQKLDETRKLFLNKTFAELFQISKKNANKELILQVLHPIEIKQIFLADLEKIKEKEHLLHPFENSKNGETELAFFEMFFKSSLFSEESLQLASVPFEKASYIFRNFSKLTQEYESGNFSKKTENAIEQEYRLKQISYIKSEVELLLEYVSDKDLFTSTLGKSYPYNKSAERLYAERTLRHIKASIIDNAHTAFCFCQKTQLETQNAFNYLYQNAEIYKAKALDFYSKEKIRLQPHLENLKNRKDELGSIVKNVVQTKLQPGLLQLAKKMDRDTLFS